MKKTLNIIGKDLDFDEPTHIYKWRGIEQTSVTTVLKQFFPFDADGVAKKCSEGRNPKYKGKSVAEIKRMWMDKAQFGTDTHAFAEDYLNGEFVSISNETERKAFEYLQKMRPEEVHTEVQIAAPNWGLAGMVDCLVKINGKWYIYDWKTDAAVRKTSFNGEKCPGILAEFDNCNYNKYSFQLSIYKLILEHVYDIEIAGLMIVHLTEEKAVEYPIPYRMDYAGLIIQQFRGLLV